MKRKIVNALSICLLFCLIVQLIPKTSIVYSAAIQIKDGDLVDFGSYPQTLVEDNELIHLLNSKGSKWEVYPYYAGNGDYHSEQKKEYMYYCDIDYLGERYRGVYFSRFRPIETHYDNSKSTVSNYQHYNNYSTNTVYWFKFEPIVWKVLDANSNLLLCLKVLDSQNFSSFAWEVDGINSNDYSKSSIRDFLNNTFAKTAFSASNLKVITETTLDNSAYSAEASSFDSPSTKDKVFLLSYNEANTILGDKEGKGTDYAKVQGLGCINNIDEPGSNDTNNCFWWLRTPSNNSTIVCTVDFFGYVNTDGCMNFVHCYTNYTSGGVRPAIHVNNTNALTLHSHRVVSGKKIEPSCVQNGYYQSDYCSTCGEYIPYNNSKIIKRTGHRFENNSSICTNGDAILFGSYPQTRIGDYSDVAQKLDSMSNDWHIMKCYSRNGAEWNIAPDNSMEYCDIILDGIKYRGIKINYYRPALTIWGNSSVEAQTNASDEEKEGNIFLQKEYGFKTDHTYWFRYEPLVWRILDKDSGLLMCESVIDSQPFKNEFYKEGDVFYSDTTKTHYIDNYITSDLRKSLIESFYDIAFNEQEKQAIKTKMITINNPLLKKSETVYDKVFALHSDELSNQRYFYSEKQYAGWPTDYAKVKGVEVDYNQYYYSNADRRDYGGSADWLLRNPHNPSSTVGGRYISTVSSMMPGSIVGSPFYFTCEGVRPCIKIPSVKMMLNGKKEYTIEVGHTHQMTSTVCSDMGKSVIWQSADSNIATVSSTGKVTANKIGKTTITVNSSDNAYSESFNIIVVDSYIPVQSLSFNRHEISLNAYDSYQIYYNIMPWNATNRKVTVSSNNPLVAEINGDIIYAKSNGTAVITMTTVDGGYTEKITVKVSNNNLEEQSINQLNYSISGAKGTVSLNLKSKWFDVNSEEYQHELAQLCSKLMMVGYSTEETIKEMLLGLGFDSKSKKTTDIKLKQGRDSVNYYYSSKDIIVNGKTEKLVIIGFIGSFQNQWFSNFDPGTGDTHKGFVGAATEMLDILRDYVKSLNISSEKTNILIFGHSRGAAVANLVAADLIDSLDLAPAKKIYTYAFATPSYTSKVINSKYNRIFNIINPEDFVPKVLPVDWNFNKYGTNYVLPTKTNTSKWANVYSRLESTYAKIKTNAEFPASLNGDVNVNNAIAFMANYLQNVDGLYNKNIVTFGKNIIGLASPALSYLYSKSVEKSFYQILQETVLYLLADNTFLDKLMGDLSDKITSDNVKHIDNFAQFLFGEFGSGLILRITNNTFDYKDFLSKVDTDKFVNNLSKGGAFVLTRASVLAVLDYLRRELSKIGGAHEAQTYVAYMEALTENEVMEYRGTSRSYFRCPVDVEIIDKTSGEIVARIINNVIDEDIAKKNSALAISVDGDEKLVVVPSDGDYEIRILGNDEGLMDYTTIEYDAFGTELRRINYFSVPVEKGVLMTADFVEDENENNHFSIINEFGEEIGESKEVSLEEHNSSKIRVLMNGVGSVSGTGLASRNQNIVAVGYNYVLGESDYTAGDYVTLTATTDANNSFLGFYEKDNLITNESTYSFVVQGGDKDIYAKFTDKTVAVTGIKIDKKIKTVYDLGIDDIVFVASASVLPSNATMQQIVWSSSDESIASVSENGVVTLLSSGTVTLTAKTTDGGFIDSIMLTVTNSSIKLGDVDGDGSISAADARLALRRSVGLETYEEGSPEFLACDVDFDGNVSAADARLILRASVGLEDPKTWAK